MQHKRDSYQLIRNEIIGELLENTCVFYTSLTKHYCSQKKQEKNAELMNKA